jgi:hypothetical protein
MISALTVAPGRDKPCPYIKLFYLCKLVLQVASHIGIIDGGRLLFQGTLSELQDAHRAQLALGVNQPEQAVHCLTVARKGRLMSMFCVLHAELLKLKRTLAFRMIFVLPLLQFFALWRTRKIGAGFKLWETLPTKLSVEQSRRCWVVLSLCGAMWPSPVMG